MDTVTTGLEALLEQPFRVMRGRVGMITNHSAVTRDLTHALDALLAAEIDIAALFGPEHGVRGEAADGENLPSSVDARTGIVIHSLYGDAKKPTPEMLEGIGTLVFDIQDVGARFYTFVSTLFCAMEAAAENDLQFVVLDRPNPITGRIVEGPLLDPKFSSFVGMIPIPIRYGMTIGELATFLNKEQGINVDLSVVGLDGWRRDMWFEDIGLAWVPPSPSMPTVDTASVYPGFCLFEGTNVSEGRGTAKPFEMIGAPWIDGCKLATEMNQIGLAGVRFRPVYFVPACSKYSGESCGGIQAHVTDRQSFRPFSAAITALDTIHQLWPDDFEFRPPDQFGRHFFDLLAGTDKIRLDILSGRPGPSIVGDWQQRLGDFLPLRENYLVY